LPNRLLWADAVCFRDTQDPSELAAQAAIAWLVHGKLSSAEHLLQRSGRGEGARARMTRGRQGSSRGCAILGRRRP
jgi:hypothetical protein